MVMQLLLKLKFLLNNTFDKTEPKVHLDCADIELKLNLALNQRNWAVTYFHIYRDCNLISNFYSTDDV